jgi:hypothetical protein
MVRLNRLQVFDVDHGCQDRIRERCHRALVRPAPDRAAMLGSRLVESAVVAGISSIYLVEVLRRALVLYRP